MKKVYYEKKYIALGYLSYVDLFTENQMAKNSATVEKFLSELGPKLKVLWKKEKKKMLILKCLETKKLGHPFNGNIDQEDFW